MNWFQRYGIPGAYFYGMSLAWTSVFFLSNLKSECIDLKSLAAFILITFLPVGYLITILQFLLYITFFGLHKCTIKMMRRKTRIGYEKLFATDRIKGLKLKFKCEWDLEAFWTHLGAKYMNNINKLKFYVEWSRKRNDIMTINASIILATLLSFFSGIFIPRCFFGWIAQSPKNLVGMIIISVSIIIIMLLTILILRTQFKKLHALMYREYMNQLNKNR